MLLCRQWTTMAVSSTSEACSVTADDLKSSVQAFDFATGATACSLSIPFKFGASAAAGSTTGLLSY